MFVLRKLLVVGIILLATRGVIFITTFWFGGKYYDSYEHSKWAYDDFRRIPLWYPYEINECKDEGGGDRCKKIEMFDLRQLPKYVSHDDTDIDVALRWLEDIQKFDSTSNAVWGVRTLYARKPINDDKWEKRYLGERYFLFTSEMQGVQYFTNKIEYEKQCQFLHLDAWGLKSFEDKLREFQETDHGDSFREVLKFAFEKGFSLSDCFWIFSPIVAWILILVWGIRTLFK